MGAGEEGEREVLGDISDPAQLLPVRNTFIHFGAKPVRRNLCQGNSDPTPPSHRSKQEFMASCADTCSDTSSQVDGGRTRRNSEPIVVPNLGSTPEHSPRLAAWSLSLAACSQRAARQPLVLSERLEVSPDTPKPPSVSLSLDQLVEREHLLQQPTPEKGTAYTPAPLMAAQRATPEKASRYAPSSSPVLQSRFGSPSSSPSPNPAAVSVGVLEGEGIFFSFTIRKADGGGLGLDIVPSDNNHFLLVNGLRGGGAIEAWNKRCVEAGGSVRALGSGDMIVCVNEKSDVPGMIEEIKSKFLLKLFVVRATPLVDTGHEPSLQDLANVTPTRPWGEHGKARLQETPKFPFPPLSPSR